MEIIIEFIHFVTTPALDSPLLHLHVEATACRQTGVFLFFCLSCSWPPRLTVRSLSDCCKSQPQSHQSSLSLSSAQALRSVSRPSQRRLLEAVGLAGVQVQRPGGLRLESCSNPRMGSSSRERN
ncbi:hypothetical protein BDV11DRAFT_37515 [Aspergillus similis]